MPRSVQVANLVGLAEVAELFGVTRQAVTNWQARHDDFPKPVLSLRCGPIYNLPDIKRWGIKTGRYT